MYDNDVYKTTRYRVKSQKWYCPNCAELIVADENSKKTAKAQCQNCGAVITKIRHSRHHHVIDIVMTGG